MSKIAGWVANSVDPDETPRFAASHLGLHCLLRPSEQIHTIKYNMVRVMRRETRKIMTKSSVITNQFSTSMARTDNRLSFQLWVTRLIYRGSNAVKRVFPLWKRVCSKRTKCKFLSFKSRSLFTILGVLCLFGVIINWNEAIKKHLWTLNSIERLTLRNGRCIRCVALNSVLRSCGRNLRRFGTTSRWMKPL